LFMIKKKVGNGDPRQTHRHPFDSGSRASASEASVGENTDKISENPYGIVNFCIFLTQHPL
jgi:hypothetical protein